MKLRAFLVLLALIYSQVLLANQPCILISGVKQDWNNAFRTETKIFESSEGFKVGDETCIIVDSWAQADEKVRALPPSDKSVLVLQFAHGGPGGYAVCNAGSDSAETINNYLNSWAQKIKVGAAIKSCYSGSLVKDKLLADAANPTNPAISNLCLTTSAPFNRAVAGGLAQLIPSFKGKSLYDAYVARAGNDIISAGPWNTSGLTTYIKDKKLEQANVFLSRMNEVIKDKTLCGSVSSYTRMCIQNPNISTSFHEKFKNYFDLWIFDSRAYSRALEIATIDSQITQPPSIVRTLKGKEQEDFIQNFQGNLECSRQKKKWLEQARTGFGNLRNALINPANLVTYKRTLKKCKDYYAKYPQPEDGYVPAKTLLFDPATDYAIMGPELYKAHVDMVEISGIMKAVFKKLGIIKNDQQFYGLSLDDYAKVVAAVGDKSCDPASTSLDLILGEKNIDSNEAIELVYEPEHAMGDLQRLMLKGVPETDDLDKKRTQACKDFIIGDN